jgi:transposase
VRDVARRHEICSSLIYRWRREAAGLVDAAPPARLVPVRVAARAFGAEPPKSITTPAASLQGDRIEIELPNGVRLRVGGEISTAALRRVVAALRG